MTTGPKNEWTLKWTAANRYCLLLLLGGCTDKAPSDTGASFTFGETSIARLLRHRYDATPPIDPTNSVADDEDAAKFGQYLFYDTRLSGDGEQSCATCHRPDHGFADDTTISTAIGNTTRHTPSIVNSAYNRWFFWDGRCDTLWCQAAAPLEAPVEHGSSRLEIIHLVYADDALNEAYTQLFGSLPDLSQSDRFPPSGRPVPDNTADPDHIAWTGMSESDQEEINQAFVNVVKSIAAFERKLIQPEAPFDRMLDALESGNASGGDALSLSAKRGAVLFVGDGVCWACHTGPTFSNKEFHNVALPATTDIDNESEGRFIGIDLLLSNPFNGQGAYSDDATDAEIKLGYLIQSPEQIGTFKTPGLRNLLDTPPYMHGGHFDTLTEVVDHYNQMDDPPLSGHREELLLPLFWTEEQVSDVVAFLESLQGAPIDEALKTQPSSPL